MNCVSSDNANMRNTEAYANMDCHGELETSRALLVESKQPGASENKPFSFLQWNVYGVFMKLKACHVLSVCLPACLPVCLSVCLCLSLSLSVCLSVSLFPQENIFCHPVMNFVCVCSCLQWVKLQDYITYLIIR